MLAVLFFVVINKGFGAKVVAMTVPFAGELAVAVAGVVSGAVAVAIVIAIAVAVSGLEASAFAGMLAVIMAFVTATFWVAPLAGSVTGYVVTLSSLPAILGEIVAVGVVLLGIYICWRALAGDEKYALVRTIAIDLAATSGTSFQKADLTDANFTKAMLKNTNFSGAILTRTRWYDTQKLDFARVGDSILAKPSVRNLLVTGKGYKKRYEGENFKGANLTGVNLNEANLKEADLSEATLQEANLEGANLTKSQAVGTDFTHAYLTGACLEAWNIDSTTKLEDIDCRYVYLLEYPDKKGNRERRPHDPDKIFETGDFAKLYQKIMNTVQILLRNGINPEAFSTAFRKLMEENPEITTGSIQGIEKKGDDVLLTLEVTEGTDKGQIERIFESSYQRRLKALSEEYQTTLNLLRDKHQKEIKTLQSKYESELRVKEQQLARMNDIILHIDRENAQNHEKIAQNYKSELEVIEAKYQNELQNVTQKYQAELTELKIKYEVELKCKNENVSNLTEIIKSGNKPIHLNQLNLEVNNTAESKAMNESSDQSRNFTVGNIGGDFKPIGSALNSDNVTISGTVAEAIHQLPVSPEPDKPGIKELLTELQAAIEAETNLTAEDQAEALEQVKALAEAGKNPQEGTMQKAAKTSIKILKGTVASLPVAATLYEASQKLLPAIAQLLSLV